MNTSLLAKPRSSTGHIGMGWIVIALVLAGVSCSDNQPLQSSRLKVFVPIPPLAYLVDQIGGELIDCETLIQPGQSPLTLDPTIQQLSALADADLYFRVGVPFETQLLPKVRSISENVNIINLSELECEVEAPAETEQTKHHSHTHANGDPHIWLDPNQAKRLASTILEALCQSDSVHAQSYRSNHKQLQASLDSLDNQIVETLMMASHSRFYVYHAAFEHFAEAYDLTQVAIEEDGKEPSSQRLAELIEMSQEDQPAAIFVQTQFASRSARAIADAIGAKIVELDPLAYDLPDNLRYIAQQIAASCQPDHEATSADEQ
jgi:zinc transport system substrate-binding protein